MFKTNNDTAQYVNQYFDVKDVPEMPGPENIRTCNISCVAMITGDDVNDILQYMMKKYGYTKKYQWEENLITYLEAKGFVCRPVSITRWPLPGKIKDDEIKTIMAEIRQGKVIFYHKSGHYQLVTGYKIYNDNSVDFILNDPAGDRKLKVSKRKRESGHKVLYPLSMIKSERLYGKCWSVI